MELKKESISSLYRFHLNYLFFGAYFLIAAVIHVFHVFLIEPSATASRVFFSVYAFVQCALETGFLIILMAIFRQCLSRAFYYFFSAVIFVLLLTHVIDFSLVRLMDMSFWFALHLVLQETYSNFIGLLCASNVSLFVWGLAALAGLSLIIFGVLLFRWTEKWTDQRPYLMTYPLLAAVMGIMTLCLAHWERTVIHLTSGKQFEMYQKTLPWKTTFMPPQREYLYLNGTLKPPEDELDELRLLDSRAFSLARKPDIYLFIIESLREDYISAENAPRLHAFKHRNVHFDLALSNANSTQNSWFSIFFSKFPFYWGKINPENWNGGSVPLQLLKKMGYQVHAFSSAQLSYYQMDHLIFGEARQLVDTLFVPEEEEFEEIYQRDQVAIEKLIKEMNQEHPSSGRVFLVFLDATHHDYSWPQEECSRFYPFESSVNYLKMALSNQGIDGIKNRYRNSLYFVDSLMGQFFDALEKSERGKEAVVVVTADHAEEFYEHGHLFHASSLTHQQTHVPLYYKFGKNESSKPLCSMTSHMDIFPTIFHYIIGEDLMTGVLQGQSIFKADRWPYVVSGRFNAARAPYEFFIHNGEQKMIARFNNEQDVFSSKSLRILSMKNKEEETVSYDSNFIKEVFGEAIDHLCPP
jgi:glucan phosphoethanolaminetransferase (alkaline phosphatase superfamily)